MFQNLRHSAVLAAKRILFARHGEPYQIGDTTLRFEPGILRGAETVLASDAVILCELHPYAWEGFGTSADDLATLLARFGRKMRYLDQAHPVEGPPIYGIVLIER